MSEFETDFHENVLTLQSRVKDKHAKFLINQSKEVNFVWNYCNDLSFKVFKRENKFCSAAYLDKFTSGATKEGLSLHSQSIQAISKELVTRRQQFKKAKLRWRVSGGARRSLGWIPFKESAISFRQGQVWYCGRPISLWDSHGLKDYDLGTGSFSEDARGRWYFNVTVKVKSQPVSRVPLASAAVGIDLGQKTLVADSDGQEIEAQRFYRKLEDQLAVAQRAGKKDRTRALHAKIKNQRKDQLHKLSTEQVKNHCAIFVGNVNSSGLAKTSQAKSVLDAGWSSYRTMLNYKCHRAGVWFREVNESYTTQECHVCHERTGPKGLEGLGVRDWTCSYCGTAHGRDHNAAINIRERGLKWLETQISTTCGEAYAPGLVVNKAFDLQGSMAAVGHGRLAGGIPVLTAVTRQLQS